MKDAKGHGSEPRGIGRTAYGAAYVSWHRNGGAAAGPAPAPGKFGLTFGEAIEARDAALSAAYGDRVPDTAHQAGINAIPPQLAPRFADYAVSKFGGPYVIARPTPANKDRYPGHTFITSGQHDKVKAQYRQEHPEAAKAYFGD